MHGTAFKLAIASGKGGTGKTTVAINLFDRFSRVAGLRVELLDCDVEEPNTLLFFPGKEAEWERQASQLIPRIDTGLCSFCRKCVDWCEFNAMVVIPPARFAEVNTSLCHSCGACLEACQDGALTEHPEKIGDIRRCRIGPASGITEGRLKIGSAMQTLLIKQTKALAPRDADVLIFDAPPGTSCPVVETVADTDYVILVTEPTPFGLYDLQLTVEMLREVDKAFGVVINKAGKGDRKVYDYLETEGIPLLAEIPFSKSYAAHYASGNLLNAPSFPDDPYAKLIGKLPLKHAVT